MPKPGPFVQGRGGECVLDLATASFPQKLTSQVQGETREDEAGRGNSYALPLTSKVPLWLGAFFHSPFHSWHLALGLTYSEHSMHISE